MTAVSVLTDPSRGIKQSIPHKLFPALALIDGKYLRFAPASVLANTAFDALTHLIESELNSKCTRSATCVWTRALRPGRSRSRSLGDRKNRTTPITCT